MTLLYAGAWRIVKGYNSLLCTPCIRANCGGSHCSWLPLYYPTAPHPFHTGPQTVLGTAGSSGRDCAYPSIHSVVPATCNPSRCFKGTIWTLRALFSTCTISGAKITWDALAKSPDVKDSGPEEGVFSNGPRALECTSLTCPAKSGFVHFHRSD